MSLAKRYITTCDEVFGYAAEEEPSLVHEPEPETKSEPESKARLQSALPDDADDEQWTAFVRGMIVASVDAVSASNGVGMFEMSPRRLADLDIVSQPQRVRAPSGRMIWVATFIYPVTATKFLRSPQRQYGAFCRSMRDYNGRMKSGEIERPADTSLSGALAVLHRAGPRGLQTWVSGERFPETERRYQKVAGIF
jgi:hypothetical protein